MCGIFLTVEMPASLLLVVALYVRKAGTAIALAVDPKPTRRFQDGGVAYHVAQSTPGIGGGGRKQSQSNLCPRCFNAPEYCEC
jgi:hypothetical protein